MTALSSAADTASPAGILNSRRLIEARIGIGGADLGQKIRAGGFFAVLGALNAEARGFESRVLLKGDGNGLVKRELRCVIGGSSKAGSMHSAAASSSLMYRHMFDSVF